MRCTTPVRLTTQVQTIYNTRGIRLTVQVYGLQFELNAKGMQGQAASTAKHYKAAVNIRQDISHSSLKYIKKNEIK